MSRSAKNMALGGMMAALAVTVMCMGGLIPVATFICPVLCMMLLWFVARRCGKRIGWAWYGAVAILCCLLSPDKEAAGVFVCLGYYPIVKPVLDRSKLRLLWKLILFNAAIGALYFVLLRLLGLEQISDAYQQLGYWMTAVMLILGNATFFLVDVLLGRLDRKMIR